MNDESKGLGRRIIEMSMRLVLVGVALTVLAALAIVFVLAGCTVPTTPTLNYEATLAYVQADLAICSEALGECDEAIAAYWSLPTQTPFVIVVTPVPPLPTATPLAVSCEEAPLGTKVRVTTRTTVRYWHDDASNNLGQAEVGATATLIDKSMDADALWWWRVEGIRTNDYPYGEKDGDPLKGWVKAMYAGCVPPK